MPMILRHTGENDASAPPPSPSRPPLPPAAPSTSLPSAHQQRGVPIPPHRHRRRMWPMFIAFVVGACAGMQLSLMLGAFSAVHTDHHSQQQDDAPAAPCPCLRDDDARTGLRRRDAAEKHSGFDDVESAFASLERKRLFDGSTLLFDPENHDPSLFPKNRKGEGKGTAGGGEGKGEGANEEEEQSYTLPKSLLAKLDNVDRGNSTIDIDPTVEKTRCEKYGFPYDPTKRTTRRRLFMGSMIADEAFTVLQTVATEIRNVFHTVSFIESNSTQAFMERQWRFPPHSPRRKVLGGLYGESTKVTVDYYVNGEETESFFETTTQQHDWGKNLLFENQIRQHVLERWKRNGMRPDDVAVFADADEMFTRDFLRALQICDIPEFKEGQDCKAPKILGTTYIFESSPECLVGNAKLWKPDALLGECVETIGDDTIHPPPERMFKGKQNYRTNGHGQDGKYEKYFALHGNKTQYKGRTMYPLWTPADMRGVAGGRQVPGGQVTAFHLHNSFRSGREVRDKYTKYAEDIPRASSVPLGLIHEDIALAVACVHDWPDLSPPGKPNKRKRLVGGYDAIVDKASVPILYQDDAFRRSMHDAFATLVEQDEKQYGSANGACGSASCEECNANRCNFAKIPSYKPPSG